MKKRIILILLTFLMWTNIAMGVKNINELKAAFVYNFIKYTYWNEGKKKITLCIVGNSEEKNYLIDLDNKYIGKNNSIKIAIKIINYSEEDINGCDVLYICKKQNAKEILQKTKGKRILTISAIDNFVKNGGIIQLIKEENRLKFIINYTEARKSKINLSSKLLRLAKEVK